MKHRQIVLLLAVDAVLVFPSASAEPGFLGSYYAGSDLATLQFERADDVIEFDWGRESPDARIPEDGFSVVWTATLTPPLSGSGVGA